MRPVVVLALALLVVPSVGAAGDGPHVLVRVENAAPTSARLHLELSAPDGTTAFDEELEVPAGATVDARVDVVPGVWLARLTRADEPVATPLGVWPSWSVATGADTTGCPAAFVIGFAITRDGYGSTARRGCATLTLAAEALREEARTPARGRGVFAIPAPGEADRGVVGPGEDGAPFEWRPATFQDAYGRPIDGHEALYRSGGGATSQWNHLTGALATADSAGATELFRFAPGEPTPVSWSRTRTQTTEGGPAGASASLEREVRYDAARHPLACFLRAGLQGRELRPGDTVPADEVCASWDGPAWRAGAPIELRGFRALPLYQMEESAERTLVARVVLVDGLAYPIDAQRYVLERGGLLRQQALTLERYQPAGAALPLSAAPPPPPAALAPLDPLRGPSGEGPRFTLAEAADAAALLPRVRLLTLTGDAALLGARYQDGEAQGARVPSWELVFSASGSAPVHVACWKPGAAAACRELAGPASDELSGAPSMGARELPALAASFDDARARWGGDAPSYALYRAWGDVPLVAVGEMAPTALAQPPPFADDAASGRFAVVELLTGRTIAEVEIIEAVSTFDPATLAPVSPASARALGLGWTSSDALPLVVGGGVGLLVVVALGLLLYSRLARARVLDDATRAAIHEVVMREPGLHASGILERLGKHSGVGEYHLDVLVREGYLTVLATPGFRRYFVTGRYPPAQMRAMAALREGQNEKLLAIIRANPGIELRVLAQEAGISVPYASKSIARLAEAGLVDKVQEGRAVTLHAAEA